ncbi:hypothetical protein SI859A1_01196 [Aurantimonas manganoxydans SI85-9A1]|uniref:Uncharacterized protein n=1 Tax=Aurantimonas manganoxydans (strain ATCC BAA-1229 / DSM 21871 / SI85-9A1) TaxID=287752 RepID=Q1YJC3_AURMS|nr:hypothetical protein SI859A1_01196 [Aurantimonas manganoxydans SI85-9A1]
MGRSRKFRSAEGLLLPGLDLAQDFLGRRPGARRPLAGGVARRRLGGQDRLHLRGLLLAHRLGALDLAVEAARLRRRAGMLAGRRSEPGLLGLDLGIGQLLGGAARIGAEQWIAVRVGPLRTRHVRRGREPQGADGRVLRLTGGGRQQRQHDRERTDNGKRKHSHQAFLKQRHTSYPRGRALTKAWGPDCGGSRSSTQWPGTSGQTGNQQARTAWEDAA